MRPKTPWKSKKISYFSSVLLFSGFSLFFRDFFNLSFIHFPFFLFFFSFFHFFFFFLDTKNEKNRRNFCTVQKTIFLRENSIVGLGGQGVKNGTFEVIPLSCFSLLFSCFPGLFFSKNVSFFLSNTHEGRAQHITPVSGQDAMCCVIQRMQPRHRAMYTLRLSQTIHDQNVTIIQPNRRANPTRRATTHLELHRIASKLILTLSLGEFCGPNKGTGVLV